MNMIERQSFMRFYALFGACLLIAGALLSYMTLGGKELINLLSQPIFKSATLGIPTIVGAALAIQFTFFCFKRKLKFQLLSFIYFSVMVGIITAIFTFYVSELLCGNIIYLLLHDLIPAAIMPILMGIGSIFSLGLGFYAIIAAIVSGIITYYFLKFTP